MLENVKDLHGSTPDDELTREQLLERLEGAKIIAQSYLKKIAELNATLDAYKHDLEKYLEVNGRMRDEAGWMALRLASAGDGTHKEKNENLLRVIADLLHMQHYSFPMQADLQIDNTPF